MMTVCSYCGRGYGEPGTPRSDTFCPRCEFCIRFVEEAAKAGKSFREWLDENKEDVDGLVEDVKKEMKNVVVWGGEDKKAKDIDPVIKQLYLEEVIRRADRELQAELKEKTSPDHR